MVVVKIAASRLFRYRLPLARTLYLKNESYLEREGGVLCLESESGHKGWGEIAPLPGFSKESLEEAFAQSTSLAVRLKGLPVRASLSAVDEFVDSLDLKLLPSVRVGLESAMLYLAAEIEHRAVSFINTTPSSETVPLNGLLTGSEDDILRQSTLLVNQGYRAIKLKIGRQSLEEDIALVYRVHARLGGKATLRLDANRAWTLEQALTFGKAVEALEIEYVEEPLQDSDELPELAKHWRHPVALDESLVEPEPETCERFGGLKAIILKPTLLGGFTRALAWSKWAEANSVMPVVSSSFETDLGLTMLGHFAAQNAPNIPCGLDTSDWFKENLLQRSLPVSHGCMHLSDQHTLPLDIRTDRLIEVFHA